MFLGWVHAEDILGIAEVLLLPSLAEGYGLNCVEAMFMKVPVIRTKTGGYEDFKDYLIGMEDSQSDTRARYIKNVLNGVFRYRGQSL